MYSLRPTTYILSRVLLLLLHTTTWYSMLARTILWDLWQSYNWTSRTLKYSTIYNISTTVSTMYYTDYHTTTFKMAYGWRTRPKSLSVAVQHTFCTWYQVPGTWYATRYHLTAASLHQLGPTVGLGTRYPGRYVGSYGWNWGAKGYLHVSYKVYVNSTWLFSSITASGSKQSNDSNTW